jgi:hypothetical protein
MPNCLAFIHLYKADCLKNLFKGVFKTHQEPQSKVLLRIFDSTTVAYRGIGKTRYKGKYGLALDANAKAI